MSDPTPEAVAEAQAYKEQGNEFFKDQNYPEAISMYSQAIEKNPNCSIFFSNRARCYFNLNNYEQSLKDAEKAVSLDDKNIKAYYLTGESLVEIAMHTKSIQKLKIAIEKLKKSLVLCPSQGKNEYEGKFVDKIYKCKKKMWILTNEEETERKKAVRSYLVHLVEQDKSLTEQDKDVFNERILRTLDTTNQQDPSKIPKALICPITKMLLKDPVCNQYGHSYSKQAYIQYLKTHNNKDPVTGNVIKYHLMYPNINVKKAIEMTLEEYPWAYDEKIIV